MPGAVKERTEGSKRTQIFTVVRLNSFTGLKREKGRAAAQLHLLSRVSIPGVVVILTVLLSPEPADFTIIFEIFGPVLCSVFGQSFSV